MMVRTEAEYHALARRVFSEAQSVLRGLTGKRDREIWCAPMAPDGFGFTAHAEEGRVSIAYQNPFTIEPHARAVNFRVMRLGATEDNDTFLRHAQMMLLWYLPHELVHAFDDGAGTGKDPSGWRAEYVASTIQPHVTARVLERLDDLPYSTESMAQVYDRYVAVHAPHLADQQRARVDAFADSAGEGDAPFDKDAFEVFRTDTAAYVYFGARLNQCSLRRETTLAELVAQYLSGP